MKDVKNDLILSNARKRYVKVTHDTRTLIPKDDIMLFLANEIDQYRDKIKLLEALDERSNEKYLELRKGMKKFRSGNFVVYDIDYLLKNLAREIFMLYQAVRDFNKPAFDFDKIRRMFVDYAPCEKCTNPDAYGTICVKCGACGRKFDDKGVLIDNE